MSEHVEDVLEMVGDHFSRPGKMVWDNHFVGMHEMVSHSVVSILEMTESSVKADAGARPRL
jgi:hypothetical protein